MKRRSTVYLTSPQNYRKVRKLTGGPKCNTRTISAVLIQIIDLMALINPRLNSGSTVDFVLFISWLVTWYFQNHFLTLYCYFTLFCYHRILSELCISFRRAHCKDFKNINVMEIMRPSRKLSYFSIFVVKMTNFDPGY